MFSDSHKRKWVLCLVLVVPSTVWPALAQTPTPGKLTAPLLARYLDQQTGLTAGEVVAYALKHNLDLEAARTQLKAARAMVQQARLRPNPKIEIEGAQQVNGGDNSAGAMASLPLELGGRRQARSSCRTRGGSGRAGNREPRALTGC